MERYAGLSRLQIRVAAGQRLMYHGTASRGQDTLLKLILAKGLDPNPDVPNWNPDDKDLTSPDGVHFTSNLQRAIDHAKEAASVLGGDPLIVVAQIDPEDSVLDSTLVPTASELLPESYQTVFENELNRTRAADIAQLDDPHFHRLVDEVLIKLRSHFEQERGDRFNVEELEQARSGLDSYIRSVLNQWAYDTVKEDLTREWELSQPLLRDKHERLARMLGFVVSMPGGEYDQVWVRSPVTTDSKENRLLAVVKLTENQPKVIAGSLPANLMDELTRALEDRLD